MDRFLSTLVTAPDWRAACEQAIRELGDIPSGWDLGFLYAGDTFTPDLGRILDYLKGHTPVRHWAGTVGNGVCSTGREEYEQASLALMVCALNQEQFRIIPAINADSGGFIADSAPWRETHGAYFATVHGDPRNAELATILERLSGRLGGGFLTGGLSSSNGDYPQIADGLTEGGVSGVLYSAEVPVVTGLSQGCSLIGQRHTITESRQNVIVRIDDRPALEVFIEDIGEILARDLRRVGGYIFCALPVAGSDTGDYLVRNLIGIDPENQLLAVGERVNLGQPVQFARRDGKTARDDLIRMLQDVKRRAGPSPRGALYHSCLGRGRQLFGEDSAELRIVREVLGDLPLVGFYANGEISHNRLYGYTGVLTVFC